MFFVFKLYICEKTSNIYSVLKAITGSCLEAFEAGIRPEIIVSITDIKILQCIIN